MDRAKDTVLEVEGMTCGNCARHVSEALADLDGVEEVEVKLDEGVAIVQHDREAATIAQLIAAVQEAGYAARLREGARA